MYVICKVPLFLINNHKHSHLKDLYTMKRGRLMLYKIILNKKLDQHSVKIYPKFV